MLKFDSKVLHTRDLVECTLENGERIIYTWTEYDRADDIQGQEVESIEGNVYLPVFTDPDHSDERPELIGFEKIKEDNR